MARRIFTARHTNESNKVGETAMLLLLFEHELFPLDKSILLLLSANFLFSNPCLISIFLSPFLRIFCFEMKNISLLIRLVGVKDRDKLFSLLLSLLNFSYFIEADLLCWKSKKYCLVDNLKLL